MSVKTKGSRKTGQLSLESFQEILLERKAERKHNANLKRLEGLQRIKDMKSSTGDHPLQLLPKEMWKKITEGLDSRSRGNISQIHDIFSDLLDGSKNRDIYFPQFLDLNIEEICGNLLEKSSPKDATCLEWPEYFLLRGVCKSARDAVDKWFEDNLLKCMRYNLRNMRMDPTIELHCGEADIKFISDTIANSIDCPKTERMKRFFYRSMILKIDPERCDNFPKRLRQLKDNMFRLLGHFGDQIWHFQYHFALAEKDGEENELIVSQHYMILREWLMFMPNLKWLELSPSCGRYSKRKSKGNEMIHILRNEPPPTLRKLERIEFDLECPIEVLQWFEAILKANPHIRIVKLRHDVWNPIPKHLLHCPTAIKSLPLERLFLWVNIDFIQPCINFNWKLKVIDLTWNFKKEKGSINEAFEFLNCFPTLENVKLWASHEPGKRDRDVIFLNLPNLTHADFKITFENKLEFKPETHLKIVSLHFLLLCKKLTWLKWDNHLVGTDGNLEKMGKCCKEEAFIDFNGGWKDLSESNVWDVFPSLEYVSVRRHDYYLNRRAHFYSFVDEYRHRTMLD